MDPRERLVGRPAPVFSPDATRTTVPEDELWQSGRSAGADQLHLLVMSPDTFTTLPLPKCGVLTLGRSSRSDIQIEDPLASREHCRLHLGDQLFIEDVGSANGTRVREQAVEKGARVPINPGEGVAIGSTVLMVQHSRSHGRQRLWSHAYFESRLEAECNRAESSGGTFALARLRLDRPLPWTSSAPIFAREVSPPHIFGAYGPDHYELLLIDQSPTEVDEMLARFRAAFGQVGVTVRTPAAWYPRDGRTADALMARVNDLLGGRRDPESAPVSAGLAPTSPAMARIHDLVERTAASTINVLIMGETGVGKDVIARVIHRRSLRAERPFLALNCAGLSETLVESELFGHEKGAFTGASQLKLGLLETAEGGTAFLDEVGELPFNMQAKLLRVIEMREVQRVGALKPRPIDVRFIAATNRDLEAEVLQGRFRRDLFFRLNGISLTIPPLRDRVGEIRLLARSFVEEACAEIGRRVPLIDDEVFAILEGYSWPGNIRELKNYMDRALVLCEDELLPEHLPLEKIIQGGLALPVRLVLDVPPPSRPSQEAERRRMIDALTAAGGNQTRAAESLGMPRRTFVSKLDRYGFPRPRKRETPPTSMPVVAIEAAVPADVPSKQK